MKRARYVVPAIVLLVATTAAGVWILAGRAPADGVPELTPEAWSVSPQGDWLDGRGIDGYLLAGWEGPSDLVAVPIARVVVDNGERRVLSDTTTATRALMSPDGTYRRAASLEHSQQLRVRLTFAAAYRGVISLYAVDWDGSERRQRITVRSADGRRSVDLGTAFAGGAWSEFPIDIDAGGDLTVTIDRLSGPSATLSGLFLGSDEPELATDPIGEPHNEVVFAWSGAVTPTSATVKARLAQEDNEVRLAVSEDADFSDAMLTGAIRAEEDQGNVVSFTLHGLDPDREYHYAVVSGADLHAEMSGTFRTFTDQAQSFTFAFGADASTGSRHEVFDAIRAEDPLFFLHVGDLFYEDIDEDDIERYREAFRTVLESPAQSRLYRSVPISYMWDDHDYGDEDSTLVGREAARRSYQEIVPHYPLVAGRGDVPIYQAFTVGRVHFIVTDLRSERTPNDGEDDPDKSMLGTAQKEWLKEELRTAALSHQLVIWVSSVPWVAEAIEDEDDWGGFSTERAEIADFIADEGLHNIVMVAGDAHMLALDDGTNNTYAAGGEPMFPVLHAAALDRDGSVKGGPYSHGTFPGSGQYGVIEITDHGGDEVRLHFTGRRVADGHTEDVLDYTVDVSVADPTAQPRQSPPAAENRLLFLVGDAAELNQSEREMRNRLRQRDYEVTVLDDSALDGQALDGYGAIVISKTVDSELTGDTLTDAPAGIVFWEDNAQALAMLATIDDIGQPDTAWHAPGTDITVEDSAPAELRAGLSGTVPFLETQDEITFAPTNDEGSTLGPDAIRVARLVGEQDRFVVYAYERGTTLADGSAAAGRRVYFGLYDDTFQILTDDGRALFDSAVDWAAGRDAPGP